MISGSEVIKEARRFGYASGNLAKNLLWGFVDVTFLFLMTDYFRVDAGLAGAIFAIALVVGAFADIWIGRVADRPTTSRWKYGRFIIWGAPLCAAAFIFLYALPHFNLGHPLILVFALCAFRCSFALIDLPHNALISSVATDSRARSRVSGYRFLFSAAASLVVAYALPLITKPGVDTGWQLMVFSCIAGMLSATLMIGAWLVVKTSDKANREEKTAAANKFRAFDQQIMLLIAIVLVTGISAPLFAKMAIYLSKYVFQSPDLASDLLAAVVCGQLVGAIIWSWLSQILEKKHVLALSHGMCATALLALFALLPQAKSQLICLCFFIGAGLSGAFLMLWAILPDLVDFAEYRNRFRSEGAAFAACIMVLKLSIGLGTALAGWTLSSAGYVADAVQSPRVVNWILILALGIPAVGSLLCLVLALRLRLTHKTHYYIADRIHRRRDQPVT